MIFYGQARGPQPVHDALPAMRVSLGALAVGTLTTWLLAGPFSRLLAESLPFHDLSTGETQEIVAEIVLAPATWIALAVVALGLAAWLLRNRVASVLRLLQPLTGFAARGLGFERLNQEVINLTQSTASALRITQTGQLNWNVVGILAGLVVVLALLMQGA
jgi:NADH-quinone oxidoreductase subunit L